MNYITIVDFMVEDLKLKGNELIVFALIYGFSQDDVSDFHGSLTYMQQRTGLSRQTVVDVLKKLVDKKLIIKEEGFRNNLKICHYRTSQETLLGVVKKLDSTSQETLPLNLLYYKDYIKDNNSEVGEDIKLKVTEIIKYLNSKTNKNFRVEAKTNREPIEARLKDGYTIRELKKVIDIKVSEWSGTNMDTYLCPQTLFRPSNFEKYLNQNVVFKSQIKILNGSDISDK